MSVSESGVGKAKTTKESRDKIPPQGAAGAAYGDKEAQTRRFLRAYAERFRQLSARGEPPPLRWVRDGRLAEELLEQYGYERLLALLERFFASKDPWVRQRGYALSCFPVLLPALLLEAAPQAQQRSADRCGAATAPMVVHGPSSEHVQQADRRPSAPSLFSLYPELARQVRKRSP